MANRAAIILSGGKSERFQGAQETWQDKALFELGGKPLLVHAIENVRDAVEEIVVCVNNEKRKTRYSEVLTKHRETDVRLVIDEQCNHLGGPIVGILTGLLAVKADYCFTLPSDMPLLQPEIIDYMFNSTEDARVVVPMWPNGRLETLTMLLKKPEVLEVARTLCQLRRTRSDDIIRGAVNFLLISIDGELRSLDPELKSFININSQTDLALLQPRQAQGPVNESLRLNFGNLPIQELLHLQNAAALFNEGNFLDASKAFSSCATRLEVESLYFWAAISRENEAKSLLNWSKQQSTKELSIERAVKGKEAIMSAVRNYESEAEMYENAHAIFLAERARSNKAWCLSWQA